jgi:hypothetical protein
MLASTITVLFILLKFTEKKIIYKEEYPLKNLIKESLVVYLCSICGYYLLMNFIQDSIKPSTEVFTAAPDF